MTDRKERPNTGKNKTEAPDSPSPTPDSAAKSKKTGEIGGPKGPEPTRYGDWERKGIAVDF